MSTLEGFRVDQRGRAVIVYRWVVFLMAAGYSVYQIILVADYSDAGGPFRFLTIWALLMSFFVASRNLAYSEGRSDLIWSRAVMITAVVNLLVVGLYWQLYFDDPANVTGKNGPPPWHQQYYLHLLGPLLQWIDALFILGAFHRWWRALPGLGLVILVYVLWIEAVVQPLNDTPAGSVTTGLPYPFLNALTFPERLEFYVVTTSQAIIVLMAFAGLAWLIRRVRSQGVRPPEAP